MGERMSWKGDTHRYQPRMADQEVGTIHKHAVDSKSPMTIVLRRMIREYNPDMESRDLLKDQMIKLKQSVSYFSLQGDETWRISFVDNRNGETYERENEDIEVLIKDAITHVFPVSSEGQPSTQESSAPPVPRNP